MISVLTVPIDRLKDGPYRNTLSPFGRIERCFATFENLVANLIHRAKAGHTLSIHVAHFSDFYLILDGHVCADVYRYLEIKEVAVILHDEITTARAALEAYIAFNCLRADWRDYVHLMAPLSNLANLNGLDSAVRLMNDRESAIDLIRSHTIRWWEFGSDEFGLAPILDDDVEYLSTNDKKLRGKPFMASAVIHAGEAHQKPPRRKKTGD